MVEIVENWPPAAAAAIVPFQKTNTTGQEQQQRQPRICSGQKLAGLKMMAVPVPTLEPARRPAS